MNAFSVFLIYATMPNTRYGVGGVRRFLALFTNYANSTGVKCRYYVMTKKPIDFGFFSPFCNTLFAFKLLITLLFAYGRNKNERIIFYVHDASYDGFAAFIANKILNVPLVLHYHNSPSTCYLASKSSYGVLTKIGYCIVNFTERLVLTGSNHVIVTNQRLKKLIMAFGVPEYKTTVLPMAISVRKFYVNSEGSKKVRKELGVLDEIFIVSYVGRLSAEKNIGVLVKAFSLFIKEIKSADARLVLVGDGPERKKLENLVASLKIDKYVIFTGFRYNVPELLNIFDIFVLPSKTEGSPLSLLEAMASGKAVIASNISAVYDIVKNGKEAILFDPNDINQLKEAILLLYNNSLLKQALSINAKRKAEQYDVNMIFPKILATLQVAVSAN